MIENNKNSLQLMKKKLQILVIVIFNLLIWIKKYLDKFKNFNLMNFLM